MKNCARSFVREGGRLLPGMQSLGILTLLLLFLAGSASAPVSNRDGQRCDPRSHRGCYPGATIVLKECRYRGRAYIYGQHRGCVWLCQAYRLGTIPSSPALRDSARKS